MICPFEHSIPAATEPIYVYDVVEKVPGTHCEKVQGKSHAKLPETQRPDRRVADAVEEDLVIVKDVVIGVEVVKAVAGVVNETVTASVSVDARLLVVRKVAFVVVVVMVVV